MTSWPWPLTLKINSDGVATKIHLWTNFGEDISKDSRVIRDLPKRRTNRQTVKTTHLPKCKFWQVMTPLLHQTSSQRCLDVTVALLLYYVSAGNGTLNHDIIMFNFMWKYLIIVYIYHYHTYIMQISIYVKNNIPEPGRNLAAGAYMGRTQLSPCIISVLGHSVSTGMPCQHDIIFFMLNHLYPDFLGKYT